MSDNLNTMDEVTHVKKSEQIAERLMGTTEWMNAKSIAITISNFQK
ncbi:hypothetical protein ACI2OX_09640 [Bacillus sp. N9]